MNTCIEKQTTQRLLVYRWFLMRWPGRLQNGSPETTARRWTPPSPRPLTQSLFSSGSWKLHVSASWCGEKSLPACWHLLCTKLQTHKDTQVTHKDTQRRITLISSYKCKYLDSCRNVNLFFQGNFKKKCIYFLSVSSISQISGRRNFVLPAPLPSLWLSGEATGETDQEEPDVFSTAVNVASAGSSMASCLVRTRRGGWKYTRAATRTSDSVNPRQSFLSRENPQHWTMSLCHSRVKRQ